MKKIIIYLCVAVMSFLMFGCAQNDLTDSVPQTKAEYTMVMPDGAPVLAAVNLIKNYPEIDGHKMTYKVVPAANIAQEYTKNADIAVLPTNAAANLYNKGVDIKLASVNVFGVMYMIGQEKIDSLSDLVGEVVYSIGKGNTPELLLKYFLSKEGIEYVESDVPVEGKVALQYVNEAPAVISAMKAWFSDNSSKQANYGVIGQPAVVGANKQLNTQTVFDFQQEWKKYNTEAYPQAGVAVKSAVANDHSFIAALRKALSENAEYITQNPSAINEVLTAQQSSLKMTFTSELVKECNIGYLSAAQAKQSLEKYFTEATSLNAETKTFFGGKLPEADFYLA